VRDWIVPVNRRHKLPALVALLRCHYAAGNSAGRRVLVEYTMLAGVNDSLEDAARLLELLEGVEAKVGGFVWQVGLEGWGCLRVLRDVWVGGEGEGKAGCTVLVHASE
jgi:hypothetical protein